MKRDCLPMAVLDTCCPGTRRRPGGLHAVQHDAVHQVRVLLCLISRKALQHGTLSVHPSLLGPAIHKAFYLLHHLSI